MQTTKHQNIPNIQTAKPPKIPNIQTTKHQNIPNIKKHQTFHNMQTKSQLNKYTFHHPFATWKKISTDLLKFDIPHVKVSTLFFNIHIYQFFMHMFLWLVHPWLQLLPFFCSDLVLAKSLSLPCCDGKLKKSEHLFSKGWVVWKHFFQRLGGLPYLFFKGWVVWKHFIQRVGGLLTFFFKGWMINCLFFKGWLASFLFHGWNSWALGCFSHSVSLSSRASCLVKPFCSHCSLMIWTTFLYCVVLVTLTSQINLFLLSPS